MNFCQCTLPLSHPRACLFCANNPASNNQLYTEMHYFDTFKPKKEVTFDPPV